MTQSKPDNNLPPSSSADSKLVSVICRTVNRPELKTALASVAAQSYSNIELVLVDALGSGLSGVADLCPGIDVNIVSSDNKLPRPIAANTGLLNAKGDYLIFLDDDDWISPSHIKQLVELLEQNSSVSAAYSSTQKVSASGELLDYVFDRSFSRVLLNRDNFIPIHAVLFEASLIAKGCHFDESLDIYEDWDFWLQVASHTEFVHLDEVTAFYRQGGESETAVNDLNLKYLPGSPNALAREKVLSKWVSTWTGADINQMLGSMDQSSVVEEFAENLKLAQKSLQSRGKEIEELTDSVQDLGTQLTDMHDVHKTLSDEHQQQLQKYAELLANHEELDRGVRELLQSTSWRITKPFRYVMHRLRLYVFGPLFGTVKKNAVKVILKNPALHQVVQETKAKVNTGPALFGLDSPSEDNKLFAENLVLQGWAITQSGEVDVTVIVDGLEFRSFRPILPRPDVARLHPQLPHAANCGFFEKIDLSYLHSGIHTLTLVLSTKGGLREEIKREFYWLEQKQLYNAWLDQKTGTSLAEPDKEGPSVAIILVDGVDETLLLRSLDSLENQSWKNWLIHYCGSNENSLRQKLEQDTRVELLSRIRTHESGSDAISSLEEGIDYLLALDAGEVLLPNALQQLVEHAESSNCQLVYSDHDSILDTDEHCDPIFTFSWSPDHLISWNYVGGIYLMRASSEALEVARQCKGNAWRYALLLQLGKQLSNTKEQIDRIAKVLWSSPLEKQAKKAQRLADELEAVQHYLSSNKLTAAVTTEAEFRYLDWELPTEQVKVSIIIPTMGKLDLLQPCINSVLEKTNYKNFELVMLDNSRGKYPEGIDYLKSKNLTVVECDEDFNWARLNNIGARSASGDLLLFLNDDIEVVDENWLQEMVKLALRPDIGTVGSMLFYPNGAIQHAGVFLVNYGGGGLHLFHKMMPDDEIYLRLDKAVREVSANTGACLLVERKKFDAVNGFDEELAVVGNDVNFCLNLDALGFRNIWTPHSQMIHHESISREANVPKKDEQAMWKRWGKLFESGDPFYNPNLSLIKWDCSLHIDVPSSELIRNLHLRKIPPHIKRMEPIEGVNLVGYIRAEMGIGEGARSDARALAAAGIDFGIINVETGNPARMSDLSWHHKEILNAPYDIILMHINGDFLPMARKELPSHFFDGRYTIGYWAWELEEIPNEWLPAYKEVDEIWVPSNFVKSAVEKHTTIPVVVIPHCLDATNESHITRDYFDIPNEAFVFLAMFDTRSIAERKNPYGVITAFKNAFSADDKNVCLVLKVNNSNGEEYARLQAAIESYPNIQILTKTHTREEIYALTSLIDCYVSLHRSEGFGLGPAEAMCLGKATILTNWSGNTDYMTAENSIAIDYELTKIVKDHGPYKAGQRWAEPDLRQASEAMQALVADPERAQQMGDCAKQTIAASFSPFAVGRMITTRLAVIRSSISQDSDPV